jgi:hypothetical protein
VVARAPVHAATSTGRLLGRPHTDGLNSADAPAVRTPAAPQCTGNTKRDGFIVCMRL